MLNSPALQIETVNYAAAAFAMFALVGAGVFMWGLRDYLKGGRR